MNDGPRMPLPKSGSTAAIEAAVRDVPGVTAARVMIEPGKHEGWVDVVIGARDPAVREDAIEQAQQAIESARPVGIRLTVRPVRELTPRPSEPLKGAQVDAVWLDELGSFSAVDFGAPGGDTTAIVRGHRRDDGVIIVDDIQTQAPSEAQRQRMIEWYTKNLTKKGTP